jgi:hypothetical protein
MAKEQFLSVTRWHCMGAYTPFTAYYLAIKYCQLLQYCEKWQGWEIIQE